MASLIEGYKYDIFISYRQKDNKYDGWVTEFVDNLKRELEATFKEEISVYFDINPHDGLLETHDVDASLKEKLKCLVFVPIISRTYCDPNSFAWEHEFKAFVEQASKDQYGLKVKLPNGNVASRVLPVRIHDLDISDTKLCESILGGVLRGIEFIYIEPGVNRPLTHYDDEKININKTRYRNQINKVALAIKGIFTALKKEPGESKSAHDKIVSHGEKPAIKEKSIIVLPFENISPDPDQEYFSDGLTEEIITDLSHIQDLLVISRSSAMTFKGIKNTIKEVAEKVNVRYVLEGSVRKAANNLRITAQLIDAESDTHIWSEKYSGTLDDVFGIQEKVSRSIVDSLRLKLTSEEDKKLSQHPIDNIHAYEYYLRAKNEIYSWTDKGLERALEYLQKGLEIIGDNILLYFGIGYVYWTYINIGFKNKEECILKAEQYANKIFGLDADSIYGHRLLGIINLRRSMLQQSVISAKKALLHDPNESDTLVWLGTAYCNTGKIFAALPLAERIVKIDPFNPFGQVLSSWIDFLEGNFSQGLKKIETANNMIPGHPVLRVLLGLYLAANKCKEKAYPVLDQLLKDYPDNLWTHMGQCLKYALMGDREKTTRAMSGGVKDKARCDLYDAQLMAECDALIGEKDEAITSLEYAVNLGAVNYPFYSEIDPFLENIRGEERFKKLMERVKYEWENFEV
jgi:TolB-like protein/tetratricopeptide (TPR) repeat protein